MSASFPSLLSFEPESRNGTNCYLSPQRMEVANLHKKISPCSFHTKLLREPHEDKTWMSYKQKWRKIYINFYIFRRFYLSHGYGHSNLVQFVSIMLFSDKFGFWVLAVNDRFHKAHQICPSVYFWEYVGCWKVKLFLSLSVPTRCTTLGP